MYRLLIFALLFANWLVFSGLFDVFHITLGVISSAIITWISADLLFKNRTQTFDDRMQQVIKLPGYSSWLLWQIVLANWHILKLAFTPKGIYHDVEPRIVRFKTNLRSDFSKFVLAQSITLTPGTVTIKIVGDEFHIHAITQFAADGLDGSMEKRIAEIFEPELASAS